MKKRKDLKQFLYATEYNIAKYILRIIDLSNLPFRVLHNFLQFVNKN